jgi:LysR family transcriptional regulator, glycine cleavage system transcriptional activator
MGESVSPMAARGIVAVMTGSRRRLPLHVLPAFEAAARHGSFRAAAAELHLTPSAISHQIRLLEEAVGASLFERLPRGLQLTDAGRRYVETVSDVLVRLQVEAEALAPAPRSRRLRVSLPDFVAQLFVLPAVAPFRARHPHIDLEINATMALTDVEAGDADAAVRIGFGEWGTLRSDRISELVGSVVAAPELAETARALGEGEALPMVCLNQLEEHTRQTLKAAGIEVHADRALSVDNYMGVVQAATHGLGVAVLYAIPGKSYAFDGRLVVLSPSPIPAPFAMYFVCRPSDAQRTDITALREWLVECIVGQGPAATRGAQ